MVEVTGSVCVDLRLACGLHYMAPCYRFCEVRCIQ